MQCKTFSSREVRTIETEINSFLKSETAGNIAIFDIKQSLNNDVILITIFYEDMNWPTFS